VALCQWGSGPLLLRLLTLTCDVSRLPPLASPLSPPLSRLPPLTYPLSPPSSPPPSAADTKNVANIFGLEKTDKLVRTLWGDPDDVVWKTR
jgi:hypothetical protein